jgi:arylsulfatase A-like enzyme
MDTYGPYEPPGEYATLYADRELSGREAQSLYQRAIDDPESITESERELLVGLYNAEIRYHDKHIGTLLDALRIRNLLEESVVIVSADHGDAFGEHGYYEHPRYLHDEITHVPLFVLLSHRSNTGGYDLGRGGAWSKERYLISTRRIKYSSRRPACSGSSDECFALPNKRTISSGMVRTF